MADDHAMFREGLRTILERQKDIVVVGEAGDGAEAVKKVAEVAPDVVLMDINMPVMDGVEASRQITAQDQRVGIIILTMYREDKYVFEAVKAGARGYVVKHARSSEVLKAIRAVHRGEALIDPAMASKLLEEFRRLAEGRSGQGFLDLSEREVEILRLVAEGATNEEIATALFLSEQTIKNNLSIIFRKLHVNNRAEAAASAIRERLI
jgi:NarL family two-component system response regulator LiaR